MKIATVTANPSVDKYLFLDRFRHGGLNRVARVEVYPSGKGINVSLALLGLGVRSTVVAQAAGRAGEFVEQSVRALGLDTVFSYTSGETRTNIKLVESMLPQVTEINEPGPLAEAQDVARFTQCVLAQADAADMLVFSGSLTPGMPSSFYADLARRLGDRGVLVAVDTEGDALRLALGAGPCWIKPNRAEVEGLLGRRLASRNDFGCAAQEMMIMGAERVVISDGASGALFASADGVVWARFGGTIQASSPFGCGDAMLAGTLLAWDSGRSLHEIARFAVAVATAAAMCEGTTFATHDQVEEIIDLVQLEAMI